MVITGPAILETCLKLLAVFTSLFRSSPAHLDIDRNLSFDLQAVRSTAHLDSAFERFPGVWVLNGYCTSRICLNCPCSCLLKCILLLKNKRNNLYSLTKVLKKWTFWSLSRYSQIDPITTNFSVLFTNIYRVTGGGVLIKLKVRLLWKHQSVLQTHI